MRTNDFTLAVTASTLNESMFKKFGVKINFDKYGREDLENYRNLLRTKVHAQESHSNFNALLNDDIYQKDKYMLNLLNTKIKEMIGESKKAKPDFLDKDKDGNKKETFKKAMKDKKATEGLKGNQGKLDVDKDGKLEKSDFAKLRAKKSKVKEGKAHAHEMAHHYAVEYMKAHRAGNLELAQEMKDACEGYGGKLSHGMAGECMHTHSGVGGGAVYQVQEGPLGAAVGGNVGWGAGSALGGAVGGALGGPIGAAIGTGVGAVGGGVAGAIGGDKLTGDSKINDSTRPGIAKEAGAMRSTAPAMEGKKAKKDYDGDGKVETGSDEYKGSRDKAIKKAMANKKKIGESIARFIAEDEEGKAKSITAGLDMVNDFTSWMQRIATYQTKSMIELSDQIRAHFGDEAAQRYKQETYSALEASLNSLTQSREQLSNAVAVLAGEAPPAQAMGQEGDMMAPEPGMEEPAMDAGAEIAPPADEFASSDAAAGGPETTGRMKRESIERGNRLMKILGA
jgi:hypothetical protein